MTDYEKLAAELDGMIALVEPDDGRLHMLAATAIRELMAERDAARADLARVMAERDRLRACADSRHLDIVTSAADIDAENARLREALEKLLQHGDMCPALYGQACACGAAALLEAKQ